MKWKTEIEFPFFPNPSQTSAPNWIPNGFLTQRSSHSALHLEELQNPHQLLQFKQQIQAQKKLPLSAEE